MSSLRRGSAVSLGSRISNLAEDEPRYEEMSDEELRQSLEAALHANKILKLENDVFERYLSRHDPQCLAAMSQFVETAKYVYQVTSQLIPITSGSSLPGIGSSTGAVSVTRDKPFRSPSLGSGQTLSSGRRYTSTLRPASSRIYSNYRITLSHRVEMASKEIEVMRASLADLEKSETSRRATIRAQIEEIELRIRETRETSNELEENVVRRGVDPLTGKIPAEKFVRFMEDWLKAADSVIEKLRLKSSSIKQQIKRTRHQLRQRQELGETLHPIDFQQLAIENQDYMKQIEEKNRYLIDLKKVTAHYNIALTSYERKMAENIASLDGIRKDMSIRKTQIEKLRNDQASTRAEVERTEKRLANISRLMDEYTAPDVLDFVKVQAELREMRKTYKRLERHRKIQVTALKNFGRQRTQLERMKKMRKTSLGSFEAFPSS